VRWSPPACRPEVFRSPRSILLLAPGILIAIFLLVNPSNGVADPLPPSKKPRELSVASVVGLKMLKTFTNLPILTFSLGSMRNRWTGRLGIDFARNREYCPCTFLGQRPASLDRPPSPVPRRLLTQKRICIPSASED
jgi:hypothetical protein